MSKITNTEKPRILFISQEIVPYIENSIMGFVCRYLPQGIQESNKDIRTFMPKYGLVNERRNQLHEVIRLSGMNLIINDVDHPVIIKVASISQARIQIYFIDNEEYFQRKFLFDEDGKFFEDNDERAIFFSKGVLETVKNLGWSPDLVNCNGWLSAFAPIYINKHYRDNPLYTKSKIVTTLYKDDFDAEFNIELLNKLKYDGFTDEEIKLLEKPNYVNLMKLTINNSDGVIFAEKEVNPDLIQYVKDKGLPNISYEKYDAEYLTEISNEFFDKILNL
ncbi:MAG: glycogen/starch synthase [Bacteroidales bacterium]|jgi:starch synthase